MRVCGVPCLGLTIFTLDKKAFSHYNSYCQQVLTKHNADVLELVDWLA